jgi:hypothetical protein
MLLERVLTVTCLCLSQERVSVFERQASEFLMSYSEAWKERGGRLGGSRKGNPPPQSTGEKLFRKYGWNTFQSGFEAF